MAHDISADRRLLLVSSRARNKAAMVAAALPGVSLVEYSYDSSTLDDLREAVDKVLGAEQKVSSVALVLHGSEKELFLCQVGLSRISLKSMVKDGEVRAFLTALVRDHVDLGDWSARMDFLATYLAEQIDGGLLAKELETMLGCQVGLSKSLDGSDIQVLRNNETGRFLTVGEMYFDLPTLKTHLEMVGKVTKDGKKKLDGYEKIRVVGKGAFGNAVLYRRRSDGLMVIIKEINMLELSASDRQMALNEVQVLAKLDHPNIVAYYDSFERDGVLMIEMEYADGGNLAEFLSKQKVRIDERDILGVFSEMVSALRYMHSRNVLHRDLKTANIFLTKEGTVKIGDFGISKMLTTRQGGAQTVLGTPYYISPEMCEGKVYDEKSDIWALGCIAYEMACLQKTFEGSNLPALVNKIMRGQFAPIRGEYSPLFKQLVRDLLQKEPEFRPTASEIQLKRLPELEALFEDLWGQEEALEELESLDSTTVTAAKVRQSRPPRSVLYYLKGYESTISLTPVQLPPRSRILQVSVSNTHIVALTSNLIVFTWGEGRRGQLGHGELESWRSRPHCVEALKTKSITHVGAGDGFSVFTSDNGLVMTCGDGSFGALGHGDWHGCATPKLVESLLSDDVSAVACGPEHVVVVSGRGDVYAWGRGEGGRLGLGHEEDCCSPQEITAIDTHQVYIVNAKCGGNATMLLSSQGHLYACGGNKYNRLGLDESKVTFLTNHVEKVLTPTRVRSITKPVVDLSMGPNHTALVTDAGKVLCMGRNSEAQLGRGHARHVSGPDVIKALNGKEVNHVSCGSTFTVVGTNENIIYFWGTRFISPVSRPNTRDAFNQSFGARLAAAEDQMTDEEVRVMMERERQRTVDGRTDTALVLEDRPNEKTLATLSTSAIIRHQGEITLKDVVLEPQEILALYASPAQLEKGETVALGGVQSQNQNVFLTVETTCPLSKASRPSTAIAADEQHPPPHLLEITEDQEEEDDIFVDRVDNDREASALPDWLKNEFQDAEDIRKPSPRPPAAATTSKTKSVKAEKRQPLKQSQQNRSSEYEKRLEEQFNRKQIEIRMEAQNAVREREKALNEEVVRLREELEKQKRRQQEVMEQKAMSGNQRKKGCSVS